MSLIIGLDTGGTYTDAALLDTHNNKVLATAKSLTTRDDLSVGLGNSIAKILLDFNGKASQIDLVTLSSTLATNAVVEGVGGRVGLFLIGFDHTALDRADLARAVSKDPVTFVAGGHRPDGSIQQQLDLASIEAAAKRLKSEVSAFAIAGHFSTRNPLHEIKARDLLLELTGRPVTCSHELSPSLGGPRRALTALLNARLINLLGQLIEGTQTIMKRQGLPCPLMVVKGDGSLLEADFALTRPVETILSGPAASLSGAAFLAGTKSALVADIGGTTTDIAFLHNGMPRLKSDGAIVGGWQTMVEAAEIRSFGLGGDSEVQPILRGKSGGLKLGPRRAVPLALMAQIWPGTTSHLANQLNHGIPAVTDARFVFPIMPNGVPSWLTRFETRLAEKALAKGPLPMAELAATQLALGAIDRLISCGLLGLAALTPTDAAHVTGAFTNFNSTAAELGAALIARQHNGIGKPIAKSAKDLAKMTLTEFHRRSALALIDSAMAHDGGGEESISKNPILADTFDPDRRNNERLICASVQLNCSLVALGASAATHYPSVAAAFKVQLHVPDHADVAGAIGAAVGAVRQQVMISVTQPAEGKFRSHLPQGPVDESSLDAALTTARIAATKLAQDRASRAGAKNTEVEIQENIKQVKLQGGKEVFVEALIQATARGRPG